MAWTAPMTAVATATFTAAQFNAYIRDNIYETMPAKATTAGGYYVTTPDGLSGIVERASSTDNAVIFAQQHFTASTTYTDVTFPVGPQLTVTTGNQAMVFMSASIFSDTNGSFGLASIDISGATTLAAADDNSINFQQPSSTNSQAATVSRYKIYDLTPGVNTFTMKYRVIGATTNGSFTQKNLIVLPL